MQYKATRLFAIMFILAFMIGLAPSGVSQVQAISPSLVISQFYGGAGCTTAGCSAYKNDYIEIFNRGTTAVSLSGLSVQYGSATGSFTQVVATLNGTLAPGQYYLVAGAFNTNGTNSIPTADATGTTAMSATAGKVALVNGTTALGCGATGTTPVPCSAAQLAQIVDLVGFGTATMYEGAGAASAPSTANADFRGANGCTETDNNNSDFTAAAAAPRNTASTLNPCGGGETDLAPTVSSVSPANGATGVSASSNIVVTFSEDVNVTGAWYGLSCTVSGNVAATVTGGPSVYTINPDADLAAENCTLTIYAAQVSDVDANDPPDTMATNFSSTFDTYQVCELAYTPIYAIQGSGTSAAITGTVTTKGIVVSDNEGPSPALRGFYVQDLTGDGDLATSDGLFVFNGDNNNVAVGDIVRVTGTASDYQDQTQISSVTSIVNCGTGSIAPTNISLPFASATEAEQYEGMLVRFPQPLFVSEHYLLGRFGQVTLSGTARLYQPTNIVAPGAPALAMQAANNLNKIILDDALQNQNADPIVFGRGGLPLSASNTLRGGDTITGLVGVMTYTWSGNSASGNAYRIRPINALGGGVPNFVAANSRPSTPEAVGGTIKVVGMNVLNYFNTFGIGNCTNGITGTATDCRGADNSTEFTRQSDKIVNAIIAINPDVLGFAEMENDGYGSSSAVQDLVNKLNAVAGAGTYAFIDVDANTGLIDAMGSDAIKVGFLYKPATVTPVGITSVLDSAAFVNGGDSTARNRVTLLQAFKTNATNETFLANINHLKSKGSACDDPDTGDGQGNCAIVRTNAVNELAAWIATDPTGTGDPDVVILGDMNSYAKEDPIVAFEAAGYTNMGIHFGGANVYSYVFDGQWGTLDYALGSSTLLNQTTGVTEFHINSDEPSVLDYNTDFKSAGQIVSLYSSDPFRTSDHDPIIVGLNLDATAPSLTVPENMTVEATSASGAVVNYSATATDNVDTTPTVSCTPASGDTFAIGSTTVNCSATDDANNTTEKSFTVTVQDTTAPLLTVPANISVEATSPSGAVVTFTPTATDAVDSNPTINCGLVSGSTFPLGTTTVFCTATDDYNNTSAAKTFAVTVEDTTAPSLTVPANITTEATGPSGAVVNFTPTATDIADTTPTISCTPASGSTFPLGTTTVSCTASDDANNTSVAQTFDVTVEDTTAPILTLPGDMSVAAMSTSGAIVNYSATALDLVDGSIAPVCVPASGSTFSLGTTTVNCTATDAHNNQATGSFNVTVTLGTQLLLNPGFDLPLTSKTWMYSVLAKPISFLSDCTVFFTSPNCSLRLVGERSTRIVTQTLLVNGLAGDQFTFGLSSRALNIPASGAYRVEISFYNRLNRVMATKVLSFTGGTHDFETLSATVKVPSNYTKIVYRITLQKAYGVAWFDDAFLYLLPSVK